MVRKFALDLAVLLCHVADFIQFRKYGIIFYFRNKDEIADDKLAGVRIFVLAGSREKFSQAEVWLMQ